MKYFFAIVTTILICFVCKAQNYETVTKRKIAPRKEKQIKNLDTSIVFKEEIAPLDCDDEIVYCKINNKWDYRRIIVTTEVVKIAKKSSSVNSSTRIKSTKISRVYFVDNGKKILLKTFTQEAYDNYIDDVLDEARLYVINELRILKPSETIEKTRKEVFKPKADTIVKQITITNNPEIELINENVENKSYSGSGNGSSDKNTYNLGSRRLLSKKVEPVNTCNEFGTVVIQIIVNNDGVVEEAKQGKGNQASICLVNEAIKSALKTRWSPNFDNEDNQTGTITYRFRQ